MVCVPKCTFFSKAVQILWPSYAYFQKFVQPLKSCTTKEKSCTSLVHCPWLLISFTMVFVAKCTFFPNLYKFCGPHMYIFKKLSNHRKKLYIFGTLSLALNFNVNGVCTKMYSFSKAVQILWSSYVYFEKTVQPLKSCTTKENRKNDLMLIMTPEKQDKTLDLSKHWSVDSTPARNEVIMKRTYPVKSVKCDKICSNY